MRVQVVFLQMFAIVLIVNTASAQSKRRDRYDSLLVGDRITPAVSSVMMPKTYLEVILSNSLLTTNTFYRADRTELDLNQRYSYYFSTVQMTYGLSASGRFNIGLDLSYRVGRRDADPDSSPLDVFGSSSDGLIQYERAFTSIGLRARYVPTRNRDFVIQQTFFVPINSSSAKSLFLGDNRYALNTQFLYTHLLGRKVLLFGQTDVAIRFKDDQSDTEIANPLNVYATYLVNRHLFPFVQLGMVNAWNNDFEFLRQSFSYGVGLQYQFTTLFNINAFYNNVFAGKSSSRWSAFNLGVRAVF